MAEICKGMCNGCPFNHGHPATEEAYNLGCLPDPFEIKQATQITGTVWSCHGDFEKICCGYASFTYMPENKAKVKRGLPLLTLDDLDGGMEKFDVAEEYDQCTRL